MLLCRRTRSFVSVAAKCCFSSAGRAEVGRNLPQDVRLGGTACAQARGLFYPLVDGHSSYRTGENIKGHSVFTVDRRLSVFALRSVSAPWRRTDRKSTSRFYASYFGFGRANEMCTVRTGEREISRRALSTDAQQKEVTVSKEGTAMDLKQPNEKPQGGSDIPKPEKQSKRMQLKKVFKEYGAVGVSFHVGISLISLGIFYLAVSSGIDMAAVLCKMGFSTAVVQSKMAAGTSTFVLAYAVHKLFAPLRISITLVSVPLIVRYLRKTGLFKPPPPNL